MKPNVIFKKTNVLQHALFLFLLHALFMFTQLSLSAQTANAVQNIPADAFNADSVSSANDENISLLAGSTGINYNYDASGNRTSRTIVLSQSSGDLRSGEPEAETAYTEKIGLEASEARVSIYPNPTDGRFTVEIGNIPSEMHGEIYLYSMQGQLVEKKTVHAEGKTDFNLSGNARGMYILNIHLGEKISTWKIIKK